LIHQGKETFVSSVIDGRNKKTQTLLPRKRGPLLLEQGEKESDPRRGRGGALRTSTGKNAAREETCPPLLILKTGREKGNASPWGEKKGGKDRRVPLGEGWDLLGRKKKTASSVLLLGEKRRGEGKNRTIRFGGEEGEEGGGR